MYPTKERSEEESRRRWVYITTNTLEAQPNAKFKFWRSFTHAKLNHQHSIPQFLYMKLESDTVKAKSYFDREGPERLILSIRVSMDRLQKAGWRAISCVLYRCRQSLTSVWSKVNNMFPNSLALGMEVQMQWGMRFTSPKLLGMDFFTWRKLGSEFHSWIASEIGTRTGASITITPFMKIVRSKSRRVVQIWWTCCRFLRDNLWCLMAPKNS